MHSSVAFSKEFDAVVGRENLEFDRLPPGPHGRRIKFQASVPDTLGLSAPTLDQLPVVMNDHAAGRQADRDRTKSMAEPAEMIPTSATVR